jgi:PAS domain-containing protein
VCLNIGLQHSWQMYAMAVIVGFVTVMVMRRWRYRRAGTGGDSSLLSLVINNMTQGVILFDAHERILVCNDRYIGCMACRLMSSNPDAHCWG